MIRLVETLHGEMFIDDECNGLGRTISQQGFYEQQVGDYVKGLCEGTVFLDVGAHMGYFSTMAIAHKADFVISVEPCPTNFKVLVSNMALATVKEDRKYFTVQCALSDKFGTGNLSYSTNNNTGDTRLTEEDGHVRIVRGDYLLATMGTRRVDFIKLDVQGYEVKALAGLAGIEWKRAIMEINGDVEAIKKDLESIYGSLKFDERWMNQLVVIREDVQ